MLPRLVLNSWAQAVFLPQPLQRAGITGLKPPGLSYLLKDKLFPEYLFSMFPLAAT